jgi:hypothetical protein
MVLLLKRGDEMTTKRELLNTLFEIAYHSDEPARNIRVFLYSNFPAITSKHLDALLHFCRPGQSAELPGMVYGMIWEAWKQLLNEQLPQ